jgi:thiol:disulfide interchange protein
VYATAGFCGYCRKMERESWAANDVIKTVNDNFVALKNDAEKHEKLVPRLDVRAYPTTLVFGDDGKHITTAEGFLSRADLLKLLTKKNSVAKPDE